MQAWKSPDESRLPRLQWGWKGMTESSICSVYSLMRTFIAHISSFAHKTKAHSCQWVKESPRSSLGSSTAMRAVIQEQGWDPAMDPGCRHCTAPLETSAGNRAGACCISGIVAPVIKWELFADNYATVFTLSDWIQTFVWFQASKKPYWLPIPVGLPTYLRSGEKPSLCKPLPMSQGWVNKDFSIFSASIPLLIHSMQHLFLIKQFFHFFALVI